jgi:hypothetical protein
MPECVVDGRPTDVALCRSCLDDLLRELRSVPWLVRQLTITLTRQARTGERNGPRSAERPLPYHHAASVDLESLRDGLGSWALEIATRRGVALDVDPMPQALSRWLLMWPSELASHPDAGELHGDVIALTKAARRTIDRHPDMRYLGPCDRCSTDLYAPAFVAVAKCPGENCDATYDIADRRAWLLEQAADQLRTARQLAYELPWIAGITITAERIGMWAVRGRITTYEPHPRDPKGREAGTKRFRVGEVIDTARRLAMEAGQTNTRKAC